MMKGRRVRVAGNVTILGEMSHREFWLENLKGTGYFENQGTDSNNPVLKRVLGIWEVCGFDSCC
jgi:hypothetical protein